MIMSATMAEPAVERRGGGYFYEPSFAGESFESVIKSCAAETQDIDVIPAQGKDRVSKSRVSKARVVQGRVKPTRESSLKLLTPSEEYDCFRRLNYLKYVLECMEDSEECLLRGLPPRSQARRVQRLLDETRERIIVGNLRLVFALARRVVPSEHSDFEELVSLGNEALMRATEKFDYRLGYRFSSYAYQAIKCAMFGWLRSERKKRERLPMVGLEFGELADQSESSQYSEVDSGDDARMIAGLLGRLDECDRQIVKARFGMDCPGAEPVPFRAISKSIGLSTTRVVQRYQRAMAKLRTINPVA